MITGSLAHTTGIRWIGAIREGSSTNKLKIRSSAVWTSSGVGRNTRQVSLSSDSELLVSGASASFFDSISDISSTIRQE